MTDLETLLAHYDYPLTPEMIALEPANPRDSSKLLVYSRREGTVEIDTFRHVAKYLPKDSLLIFNDTKVIPARIPAKVRTGGRIELLCTKFKGAVISALCERYLPEGTRIAFTGSVTGEILGKHGKEYSIRLNGTDDIRSLMLRLGTTPLPPYLKDSPLSERERRKKYQAIFARKEGSIAAPTASLHFTRRVVERLTKRSIDHAYVTLHVNLGTFMPLTEDAVQKKELHEERFEITPDVMHKLTKAKRDKRPIITVGTTALRAVESAFNGKKGSTRLFIQEGYEFKAVNGLITNFHVPRSSLMMLVAALVGREKLLELYSLAKKENFRFLSFGDGMLIL